MDFNINANWGKKAAEENIYDLHMNGFLSFEQMEEACKKLAAGQGQNIVNNLRDAEIDDLPNKYKVVPIKGKAHGGMNSISAESISVYMWGKDFTCYTIFKNDVEVPFKTSDINEFRKYLLSFNEL